MYTVVQILAYVLAPAAALASTASSNISRLAEPPTVSGYFIIATMLVSAATLVFGSSSWALAERTRSKKRQESAQADTARVRADLFLRDALVNSAHEAIAVLPTATESALSFGGGSKLLDSCLSGPDATLLASALSKLAEDGAPFALSARSTDGRAIIARGRPIGSHAAVFLRPAERRAVDEYDCRAMLDALPMPIWLRDKNLGLRWGNHAFVSLHSGSNSAVLEAGIAFDRSEKDLASTARETNGLVEAKRYANIGGVRRALSFALAPLPNGGTIGTARDITDLAQNDAKLRQDIHDHTEALNILPTAIAIFAADQRLVFYNRTFVHVWGLGKDWLDTHPLAGEVLDKLRDLRRLPEQRDFAQWKRERLHLFDRKIESTSELLHLPDGKAIRVTTQSRPFGGLILVFEDVSSQLQLESSYNSLVKVQQATLDALEKGIAVFGPDGRLRLYNAAFARQWRLTREDLDNEPHLKRIADACWDRFGHDSAWDIVMSGVTSATPERNNEWSDIERSDGTVLSLSLTRLPDGATLASFTDITDHFRLEAAVKEVPVAAA